MPKLETYDDTGAHEPLSPKVQMNIDARIAAGGWSSKDEADKTKAIAEAAAVTASAGATNTLGTNDKFGDFINSKWRPMMAFIYMITCATDFIIFPVLWSVLQAVQGGQVTSQWSPLTLQGAGLYHIAMGAVLGLAAYGRSQEKIEARLNSQNQNFIHTCMKKYTANKWYGHKGMYNGRGPHPSPMFFLKKSVGLEEYKWLSKGPDCYNIRAAAVFDSSVIQWSHLLDTPWSMNAVFSRDVGPYHYKWRMIVVSVEDRETWIQRAIIVVHVLGG